MSISEKLAAYVASVRGKHDREYSWAHCYGYFHDHDPEAIRAARNHATLHLGFYLASWGMLRNSFLLEYASTIHLEVVDCLIRPEFSALWHQEFGASDDDGKLIPLIIDLCERIRSVYRPFAEATDKKGVTETLVTKVLLGTMGCFPALDGDFTKGYRHFHFKVSDPVNIYWSGVAEVRLAAD